MHQHSSIVGNSSAAHATSPAFSGRASRAAVDSRRRHPLTHRRVRRERRVRPTVLGLLPNAFAPNLVPRDLQQKRQCAIRQPLGWMRTTHDAPIPQLDRNLSPAHDSPEPHTSVNFELIMDDIAAAAGGHARAARQGAVGWQVLFDARGRCRRRRGVAPTMVRPGCVVDAARTRIDLEYVLSGFFGCLVV